MSRAEIVKFDMIYKVEFTAPIRGHHIYKETWQPKIGEELACHRDEREGAVEYDPNAIGVFKPATIDKSEQLIGHVPIEISALLNNFLLIVNNKLSAIVKEKRKREIGLVVPAKFIALTKNKTHAKVLVSKLLEKKCILSLEVDTSKSAENDNKMPRLPNIL